MLYKIYQTIKSNPPKNLIEQKGYVTFSTGLGN